MFDSVKVGIEHIDKNRPISQYMAIMNVKASPIFHKNLFIDKNILIRNKK